MRSMITETQYCIKAHHQILRWRWICRYWLTRIWQYFLTCRTSCFKARSSRWLLPDLLSSSSSDESFPLETAPDQTEMLQWSQFQGASEQHRRLKSMLERQGCNLLYVHTIPIGVSNIIHRSRTKLYSGQSSLDRSLIKHNILPTLALNPVCNKNLTPEGNSNHTN